MNENAAPIGAAFLCGSVDTIAVGRASPLGVFT